MSPMLYYYTSSGALYTAGGGARYVPHISTGTHKWELSFGDAVGILFSPMTKMWYWYPRFPLKIVKSDPEHPFFGKNCTPINAPAKSKCEYQTFLASPQVRS